MKIFYIQMQITNRQQNSKHTFSPKGKKLFYQLNL
jgi:hypothetical protein